MRKRRTNKVGYLYVLPAFALYGLFVLAPALHTVYLSFFEWNGLGKPRWTGLHNFGRVFSDPLLTAALKHSFFLLAFFTVLPIAVALLVTVVVGRRPRRGLGVFRTVFFLPQVVPLIAIGIMWRWFYATLPGPAAGWLGSFTYALPAIGLIGTWALYGVCLTLFLAGVQKLDPSLYDAVAVDGGGAVWQFRAVILPGLRREIALAAAITGIAALATFDLVYITTLGGPGDATVVPGLLVYQLAFTNGEVGAAAALAVCLTVVTGLYVALVNRIDSGAEPS
jgi:ABC-type sugar transport system permease subunit